MLLLDYLNNHIELDDNIIDHFYEAFGVNVKILDDLYLFKYDQIKAKWNSSITHECRGTIVRKTDDGWVIVSHPFDKFFNQDEGKSGINDVKIFNDKCSNYEFYEKTDGTCIQLWYDTKEKRHRVSTLGSINNESFEQLFYKVISLITHNHFDKNTTYLFELCTEENHIVTKYSKDSVFLLAARDIETGEYKDEKFLNDVCNDIYVIRPKIYKFTEYNIKTLDDACKFVEENSKNTAIPVEDPEGFVVYEYGMPIAKMKRDSYLKLHAFWSGNDIVKRKIIIDRYFNNSMDDLIGKLSDDEKEYVNRLSKWYSEFLSKQTEIVQNIKNVNSFTTQKEYAMFINKNVDSNFRSFYFTNKETIISAYFCLSNMLLEYISNRLYIFEKILKDL